MEFNLQNLSQEDLDKLELIMLRMCQNREPWADMMMLGGAGDGGYDHFPLDLEHIESIDITVSGSEGTAETVVH